MAQPLARAIIQFAIAVYCNGFKASGTILSRAKVCVHVGPRFQLFSTVSLPPRWQPQLFLSLYHTGSMPARLFLAHHGDLLQA